MSSLAKVQTTAPALKTRGQAAAVPASGVTRDTTAAPPGISNRALQAQSGAAAAPAFDPVDYAARWLADSLEKDDVQGALAALAGHDEAFSQQLESAFRRNTSKNLRSYLRLRLGMTDDLVTAYGLLRFPRTDAPACQMAKALITSGVRDDQILPLLNRLDLAGRQRLKREYEITYYGVTRGLEGDLRAAYTTPVMAWIAEKAIVMLKRDLTWADELYFLTEGIVLAKSKEAVKLLQDEWAKGPDTFARLDQDWHTLVKGTGLSKLELEDAMRGHLFGREWRVAEAIFAAYHRWRNSGMAQSGPKTADQLAGERDLQAQVAFDSLGAATWGPGRTESYVFRAAEDLHRVRVGAILAAETSSQPLPNSSQAATGAWADWEKERAKFLEQVAEEMKPGSDEYERVRLILMADPRQQSVDAGKGHQLPPTADSTSLTDQLYMAWKLGDGGYDKAIAIIKKAWVTGQIEELRKDAAEGKTVNGVQIREPFPLHLVVTVEHMSLVERGWSDARRGGRQLWVELMGSGEAALKRGYEFLTLDGMTETLRKGVISECVAWAGSKWKGATAEEKLWDYIKDPDHYPEDAPSRFDFEELLMPPKNDSAKLELLHRKRQALGPGAIVGGLMAGWDALSGEDRQEIEEEEFTRLQYLLDTVGRDPKALEWLREQTGAKSVEELIAKGFDAYKAALGNLVEFKHTVVSVGTAVVQTAVTIVLSIFTAGTALAFLPGIASTLTGIGLKKMALGGEVEVFSDENLKTVGMDIATAITGGLVSAGMTALLPAKTVEQLQKADELFEVWKAKELAKKSEIIHDLVKEATTTTMKGVVNAKQLPTAGQLAEEIALFATGQGLDHLGEAAKERITKVGSVLSEQFYPALAKNAITGGGEIFAQTAIGGFQKSSDELINELGAMSLSAVTSAAKETVKEQGKSYRKARAQAAEKAAERERKLNGPASGAELSHGIKAAQAARLSGPNAGFYKQYRDKPTDQIESAVRELKERTKQAEGKLAQPEATHKVWNELTPEAQQKYAYNRRAEVQQNWERIAVLEAILREREVPPPVFQNQ